MELPDGVKIASFQPSAITIHLEPVVERQLEVEPKFEGKPAQGYEIYNYRNSKGSVTVRGPTGHINVLQKASTETISIAGRNESFTAQNVAINIPDPKVDLLDPVVNVEIEIGERRTEKAFAEVSVAGENGVVGRPRTATVTLFGPASQLEQLNPEDIKVVLDLVGDALKPRLKLPPAFQGKVTLKSINPAQFSRIK